MQVAAEYCCSYCGEMVSTTVDISAGDEQSYVEDCAVCCRPNVLRIMVDRDTMEVEISAEFEG
jgi:hypothetical protein